MLCRNMGDHNVGYAPFHLYQQHIVDAVNGVFAQLMGESMDIAEKEQGTIIFCQVIAGNIHEDFLGHRVNGGFVCTRSCCVVDGQYIVQPL